MGGYAYAGLLEGNLKWSGQEMGVAYNRITWAWPITILSYLLLYDSISKKIVRILFPCAEQHANVSPLLDMNTSPYVADFNTTGI